MTCPENIRFEKPRRKDRAIDDEAWIRAMLERAPLGTLATIDEGGPALNPNLFVFDPEARAIYLHTAKSGNTRTNVESRQRVAFCVSEMGRLLPADAAVHFSVEYASVIARGLASVVDDEAEAARALDLLMRKYAPHLEPGEHYRGVEAKDLARTSVYRVEIESWSAKGKVSNAPDAYAYRAPSPALDTLHSRSGVDGHRR